MPLRRELAAVIAGATLLSVTHAAKADPLADLEKAHSAYVSHRYDDAESRLRALLDPSTGGLKDPDTIADARMYLGAVLVAEGKKEEAASVFEQLLLDRHGDYQPDPLRVSQDAIDAFIDARTRVRDQLNAIQAEQVRKAQDEKAKAELERQRAADRLAMLEKLATTEVVVEHRSRWIALLPFGAGQFQNNQKDAAWLFLSSEVLLAAGSFVGGGLSPLQRAASEGGAASRRRDGPRLPAAGASVGHRRGHVGGRVSARCSRRGCARAADVRSGEEAHSQTGDSADLVDPTDWAGGGLGSSGILRGGRGRGARGTGGV